MFSVWRASAKSGCRVTGSMTTFSITDPKRMASQICGSLSRRRLMHLA